jgi:hypothetical protein
MGQRRRHPYRQAAGQMSGWVVSRLVAGTVQLAGIPLTE